MQSLFIHRFLAKPKSVGSLIPSSRQLGKSMAKAVTALEKTETIVEIGAGTGAITEHLQSFNPVVIEIEPAFTDILQRRFPDLDVRQACGLQFLQSLSTPIGLVISVPLINNPLRQQFMEAIRLGHQNGLIRWCVIFTYGMRNPLETAGFTCSHHHQWVLLNAPPAHVWVYH